MSIAENYTTEPTPPPPRIDRLSPLPDELLHSIFDSAYSTVLPRSPLSKHLYPFFEQHLYRNVLLSSHRQVDLFLETITAHPERGKLVKSLAFARNRDDVVKSLDVFEALCPLLPNLIHLEIKAESIEVGTRSKVLFGTMLSVKSVSTEPKMYGGDSVNLDYFAFLASLPSLAHLTVCDWPSDPEVYVEEEEALHFPNVTTLRIEGVGADENSIKVLVDLCPALLSVDLSTDYTIDRISYEEALRVLPSTIHSLKLRSDYAIIEPADVQLRRFNQLRSLDLDHGCYSQTIHSAVSHLSLLVAIRLGRGTIDPIGFLILVSGPSRLVNLKLITLDFDVGTVGNRVSSEAYSTSARWKVMQGWELSPDLVNGEEEDEGYISRLKELIAVAERNGIKVEGTVHQALANFEAFSIEEVNRAVLDVTSGIEEVGYLAFLRDTATRMGLELPSPDIDSLDLTRLELITIDLPERNWYMYSLRNGGEATDAGDEVVSGGGSQVLHEES